MCLFVCFVFFFNQQEVGIKQSGDCSGHQGIMTKKCHLRLLAVIACLFRKAHLVMRQLKIASTSVLLMSNSLFTFPVVLFIAVGGGVGVGGGAGGGLLKCIYWLSEIHIDWTWSLCKLWGSAGLRVSIPADGGEPKWCWHCKMAGSASCWKTGITY